MKTPPTPSPLDPRDIAAVQGFALDSMPDLSGAVLVTLSHKSRTRAVRALETALASSGATLGACVRCGDNCRLEVIGGDAGVVPVHMLPAANLRRMMILRGQSQAAHGLAAWPELEVSDVDLALMANAPGEDDRTRAAEEMSTRARRAAAAIDATGYQRKDRRRLVARNRTGRTLAGDWPSAAKAIAHARGVDVEVDELYRPLSYPLLWCFTVAGPAWGSAQRSVVAYVSNWTEVGPLVYSWVCTDGDTLETAGVPDDLVQV